MDSASVWAAAPATVAGLIAPARMNGVMITAWFARAYVRAAPSIVESHTERGVRVDEAHDHSVVLEIVRTEQDPRHVDRVLRALRMGDRAHERLVRVAHVRVDHVVVPLVHGEVDRLADRASRVVQVRRRVRQLYEVTEVFDRPVAPAAVQIAYEFLLARRDNQHDADLRKDVVVKAAGSDRRHRAKKRPAARQG